MRTRTVLTAMVCLHSGVLGACGSSSEEPGSQVADYADGASEASARTDAQALGDSSRSATRSDGGVDASPLPSCTPEAGPDDPDDNFTDTNCDGIDGDRSRAIFVSPSGDDAGAGSAESPVKTLGKAIALAVAAQKDVYVCNATYAENVTIASAVRMFGGYDCNSGWARGTDRAYVAPGKGVALTIKNVMGAVAVDRIDFAAADAVDAGESSIAAFVAGSNDVRLSHASLNAGSGADGTAGEAPASAPAPAPAAQGGGLPTVVCANQYIDGTNCLPLASTGANDATGSFCQLGGPGGDGANIESGLAAQPGGNGGVLQVGSHGAYGLVGGAPGGAVGHAGIPGSPASAAGGRGDPAISGFGSVTKDGYAPSNVGTAGKQGPAGQAGGGGSGGPSDCCYSREGFCLGGDFVGGGGGQGGHGGCGGSGGKPGGGGGASIALLVFDSRVQGAWLGLKTSEGGRGGNPSAGAQGQPGGQPGKGGAATRCGSAGVTDGDGYPGGAGARGGTGGPGGPGGGGPSIALFSSGPAPVLTSVTFETGRGGPGGAALSGPNGPDGISQDQQLLNADGGAGTDTGTDR